MKAIVLLLAFLAVIHGLDSRWKLMWEDNFDGDQLDKTKWGVRYDYWYKNGNYFRQDYSTVSNGKLVIKSDRRAGSPNTFETGYLDTAGLAYWTHGRFEVYAKLPPGQGMWPAHWMLSETRCWPYGTEIDIMELPYGHPNEPTSVHGSLHYGPNCGVHVGNGTKIAATSSSFFDNYHSFVAEWSSENVTFYLDDTAYGVLPFANVKYDGKTLPLDVTPHYFILNTFIGGWSPAPGPNEVFPKYHYVDYVRAYGWQPCVQGCGEHGVCDTAKGICKCDSDYAGTFCEFSFAKPYSTNFATATPDDSLEGSTAEIKNGLALTINATGCPSACTYSKAKWAKNEGFGSGNFTFVVQAPNISGYGLLVDGNGGDVSAQGFRLTFSGGNTLNRFAFQTTSSNHSFNYFNYVPVSFNPSLAHHTYTVQFLIGKSYTIFADGVKVHTVDRADTVTNVHLYPRINYEASSAYYGALGAYKPSTLLVKSFSFTPVPGVKLPRPTTTSSSTSNKASTTSASPPSSTTSASVPSLSTTSGKSSSTSGSSEPPGTGLRGNYYGALLFSQFKGSQVDPLIDFNWGTAAPSSPAGMPADYFTIRWSGWVKPLYSVQHTFYVKSDDGCNLWVNGVQLINAFVSSSVTIRNGTLPLLAGVKYNITLEYIEVGGNSLVSLYWSTPMFAQTLVPTSQLYPA